MDELVYEMSPASPAHEFSLDELLQVKPPNPPVDFAEFWKTRYQRARKVDPLPQIKKNHDINSDFNCFDLRYRSTEDFNIEGWLLVPKHEKVTRGVIVGHGYGGREAPDFHLPIKNAVFMFPCFRGLSRSHRAPISTEPQYHVLHDIDKQDKYILGGCVEDVWLAVSALTDLFPWISSRIAYLGISFGGGIGALALAWEQRIKKAHFNVPSFGNYPVRMKMPTMGSAASVQSFYQSHRNVLETLVYYDAAIASRFIQTPVHVAAALSDPVVTPPGQFSIYNGLKGKKQLFVLNKGHAEYAEQAKQEKELIIELQRFFNDL